MTDTTDTARLARELRHKAGMRSNPPSPMAAGVPIFVYDEETRVLLSHAAAALERLAAENADLRTKLDAAVQMLAGWCRAVAENGNGWDDWDEHYKDAAYRDGPLRAMIDDAMAEGNGDE